MTICVTIAISCGSKNKNERQAVKRIDLKDQRSEEYLPYATTTLNTCSARKNSHVLKRTGALFRPEITGVQEGIFAAITNPEFGSDRSAQLSLQNLRTGHYLRDYALRLMLYDLAVYRDSRLGTEAVVVSALRSDSSFIFKASLDSFPSSLLFLATGGDHTGDGAWHGRTALVGIFDYDFDGLQELFCYIDPERDLVPRMLVCVELESMSVEWRLPLASLLQSVVRTGDSTNSAILISTWGPANGSVDSIFTDQLGYIAKIDRHGRIEFVWPSSRFGERSFVIEGESDSVFYVAHTIPLGPNADTTDAYPRISKLNRNGALLASRSTTGLVESIVALYRETPQFRICVLDMEGVLTEYDGDLKPTASGPSDLIYLVGATEKWQNGQTAVLAMTNQGTRVFDVDWRPLAALNGIEPAIEDQSGSVSGYFSTWSNRLMIEQVERRGIIDYVSIVYLEYQKEILAILAGLVVGLVLTNHYRRRTKSNLATISRQKRELEDAHKALRDAQQLLIEQEKYRQAKDIAGGFAHEIRNALFPGEGALLKLRSSVATGELSPDRVTNYADRALRSMSRALSMTDLVLRYTRLDQKVDAIAVCLATVVRSAVEDNLQHLEEAGVRIHASGEPGLSVDSNPEYLRIVVNNLILNSIDALVHRPDPHIDVSWRSEGNQVVLVVADNGIGIDADSRTRIFDTFFTTKPRSGTGLGLSMSKKIIELYGGSISFESRPGDGTTFRIQMNRSVEG
jgi:signal transduction histidine kinase